ncbi:flavin-containing monooxygenase [Nocardia sp. Marseille-Q1738]
MISKEWSAAGTPDVEIAIVGAGLAGVGISVALQRAGLTDFQILDRESDFGGTWHVNRYPDVGADIPGFVYQFSFAKFGWSRFFPKGEEIRTYIATLVERYDLRAHARLNTDVLTRTWDEDVHLWRLELGDGSVLTSRFLISADGMFIEPKTPDFAGMDGFAGDVIHSQGWVADYDFGDKRVGVIGTGASAVQLVPEVAAAAGHLTVFQRRGVWVFPKPDFRIPAGMRWLLQRSPQLYGMLYSLLNWVGGNFLGWLAGHGVRLERFMSIPQALVRAFIWTQVRDAEVRRKLLPGYAIMCKRPTISNRYYATFAKDNVKLVTEAIESMDATGIVTADGAHHAIDTLVLATGFEMAASSTGRRSRPVRGRGGFDLADHYANDSAGAEFEGLLLPELPNSFIVCGRYSWSGLSHISIIERAAILIVRLINEAGQNGASSFNVTPEAAGRFSAEMFAGQHGSFAHVEGCRGSQTYFLDEHGVSSVYRPTSMTNAMRQARNPSMSDFEFRTLDTNATPTAGSRAEANQ